MSKLPDQLKLFTHWSQWYSFWTLVIILMFFIHYLLFKEKNTALNLLVTLNEDDVLDYVSISSLPDIHGPCMAEASQSVPYPGWGNDLGGPSPFQRKGNLILSVNRMGTYFFVCHGQYKERQTIVQSEQFGHVKFQKVRVTVWFLLCGLSCYLSMKPRRRSP